MAVSFFLDLDKRLECKYPRYDNEGCEGSERLTL